MLGGLVIIRLFSAATVLLSFAGAGMAQAQNTAVIIPPKRADTVVADSVRRAQAAQDSVARVTLTDMKQWVDSAAQALAVQPDTGAVATPRTDTAAAVAAPATAQRPDSAVQSRPPSQAAEFRDGARAPDTATPFPTFAVIGGAMVLAGIAIGRRRRVPAVPGRRP
jgi:hypothetical protein